MDIKKLDAEYGGFPSFSNWSALAVDEVRWDRYKGILDARIAKGGATLDRALRLVRRLSAVETGQLEKLYELDRGTTLTIAQGATLWRNDLQDEEVVRTIEGQLDAYELILDFATSNRPLAEAWIRELHQELLRGQDTYSVHTELGPRQQQLPKGVYKSLPNHVQEADGTYFAFAPVDMVGAEMNRLLTDLTSEAFESAHPVIQAAFSHYALARIHPFADGNGRVARGLASVFSYRAASVPLLIYGDEREAYLDALKAADSGSLQRFVQFIEGALSASMLTAAEFAGRRGESIEQVSDRLVSAYTTKGGLPLEEVDRAAKGFLSELHKQLGSIAGDTPFKNASVEIARTPEPYETPPSHRLYRDGKGGGVIVIFRSTPPYATSLTLRRQVLVPRDATGKDDILIIDPEGASSITCRVDEALPNLKTSAAIRVGLAAEGIIEDGLAILAEKVEAVRKQGGGF